jgi:hypothetical protein
VSSVCQSTVPVFLTVRTTRPSTASDQVFACPHGTDVVIPTETFPLTVSPGAGALKRALNEADGDGVGVDAVFRTVTATEAVPALPAASVAVAVSVCEPSATVVVFQLKLALLPV